MQNTHHHNNPHVPVLLSATLDALCPQRGESYLDLTAGYGGHASAIIDITQSPNRAVLVDRDLMAIETLTKKFGATGTEILHKDSHAAASELASQGRAFDMILMDLGVSSPQLVTASRGFSFERDGPLDMRMDQRTALTADELVNTLPERELANLLKEYGEEPLYRRIASAIIRQRPIHTTRQLADVANKAYGRPRGKTHPATRTFQALRIAVNKELDLLEETLQLLPGLLLPGGRLAIISFHSLEDRKVKQFLREKAGLTYDAELKLITKRPTLGTEDVFNPRARSARLRAAVKLKTERG